MSVNKVALLGYLGRDPEVRTFGNGGRVCNLRIATTDKWTDKATGEKRESTQWHSVAIFADGIVGVAERFLAKGGRVYVEGQLETRKWQDQSGQDRYTTEVVLRGIGSKLEIIDFRGDATRGGNAGGTPAGNSYASPGIDDEIPF